MPTFEDRESDRSFLTRYARAVARFVKVAGKMSQMITRPDPQKEENT